MFHAGDDGPASLVNRLGDAFLYVSLDAVVGVLSSTSCRIFSLGACPEAHATCGLLAWQAWCTFNEALRDVPCGSGGLGV